MIFFKKAMLAGTAAMLAMTGGAMAQQALPDRLKAGALMVVTGPAVGSFFHSLIVTRMAVKDVNDAGGIAGKQVDLIVADTQFPNTAQAVSEARRLAGQEKVHFIAGPLTTQEALAVAPIFTEANLLFMTTAASSAFNATAAPTGFSTYLSVPGYSKAMVQFAKDHYKAKSIALITDSGGQSKDAQLNIRKFAEEAGLKITGEQEHEPAFTDATAQLLSLRRGNPDVVLQVASSGQDAGVIFKGMSEIGWSLPVISQVAATVSGQVLKVAGPDVFKSGKIVGVNYKEFMHCSNDPVGNSPFGKWLGRLKEYAPRDFDNLSKNSISFTYDAYILTKNAIEATKSVDGRALAKWLETESGKFVGISGPASNPVPPSHHLFGPEAIGFTARPDVTRADYLSPRVGC